LPLIFLVWVILGWLQIVAAHTGGGEGFFNGLLEQDPNKRKAVAAIFRFFEVHSDKDLGSPGPLVHFLEEENDYLSELEKSVLRKPTDLTVWMINRIMNGADSQYRKHWLAILGQVINHPEADADAIESAKGFIDYQNEKI